MTMSNIPLYPRGRMLKNLIADFKSKYQNTDGQLLISWDYGNDTPTPKELDEVDKLLYSSLVEHWYFCDIGFDSDDEFIYRLNSVWNREISKYKNLIKLEKETYLSGEFKDYSSRSSKSGEDTITKEGSKSTSHSISGTETLQKGVSTTSTQTTGNEGNKLARTTPNEQLSVKGTSNTTVTDSGEDKNIKSLTETTTETPSLSDTHTYGSGYETGGTERVVKLTATDFKMLSNVRSILHDFVMCFEKLFMEVF